MTKAAWEDPDERPGNRVQDSGWHLGSTLRTKGSIHSDTWSGSAAELAARGYVGVYPVTGWWRERKHLRKWNKAARYALLVTIESRRTDLDIYQAIVNQIPVSSVVEVD